jgi:hypothetical protein
MTDTTEKTIDIRTVYSLLAWQENGGLLGHPDLDTFLELLSEARHDDEATTYLSGTTRSLDSGRYSTGDVGCGRFVLIVATQPAWVEPPKTTTVRTRNGDLTFDGDIRMACFAPSWFVPDGKMKKISTTTSRAALTLDQVLLLSGAVKDEEDFYDDIESQCEQEPWTI